MDLSYGPFRAKSYPLRISHKKKTSCNLNAIKLPSEWRPWCHDLTSIQQDNHTKAKRHGFLLIYPLISARRFYLTKIISSITQVIFYYQEVIRYVHELHLAKIILSCFIHKCYDLGSLVACCEGEINH